MSSDRKYRWSKFWFWPALISSWFTFITFFTLPIGLLFWILSLIILFVRKSELKWYLIAFSAWTAIPTISFVLGVKDYLSGNAHFRYVGLPGPEFYNLDRDHRVWNSTSGCIVLGYESLTQVPNNWAVTICTNLFGFQSGIYTGDYPDKTEAQQILYCNGQLVSFSKKEDYYQFQLVNTRYSLTGFRYNDIPPTYTEDQVNVALVNNQLLIFSTKTKDNQPVIFLADTNGQIFARYY